MKRVLSGVQDVEGKEQNYIEELYWNRMKSRRQRNEKEIDDENVKEKKSKIQMLKRKK